MATVCRSPVLWRRESAARTGKRKRRESTQWLWPLLAPVGLALVTEPGGERASRRPAAPQATAR